jgi:hypothetical protein
VFSVGAAPDKANSDHTIVSMGQGGLGLPDRDYYTDEGMLSTFVCVLLRLCPSCCILLFVVFSLSVLFVLFDVFRQWRQARRLQEARGIDAVSA